MPGHTHPELDLVDERGKGYWFLFQAAVAKLEFGSMHEERPILQKGDNYIVPEERGGHRYMKQFLSAKSAASPPEVRFVMERVEK